MTYTTIIILVVIGLLAGILSGIVGIGGGLIIIPMLILFLGTSQHVAQGTSLAVMLPPIGFLAALNYYKSGYVDIFAALFLGVVFTIFIPSATVLASFTTKPFFSMALASLPLKGSSSSKISKDLSSKSDSFNCSGIFFCALI